MSDDKNESTNDADATGREFQVAGETWHQTLMEDFRFMEAARMESGEYEGAGLRTGDITAFPKLRNLMITNGQSLVNFPSYNRQLTIDAMDPRNNVIVNDFRTRHFLTRVSRWPPLPIYAKWILDTKQFKVIMIVVIVLNSILMAFDGELPYEIDQETGSILDAIDYFFLCMFVAEIVLKWIDDFKRYWTDSTWNTFDFIVTAMSLTTPVLDVYMQATHEDDHLLWLLAVTKYIRILRILRSLNVVTRVEKILIIWEAITRTAKSLLFITLLQIIFFFIFAVIAIYVFDRINLSHRADLEYKDRFKGLPIAFVTLFQFFTLDKWLDIIMSLADGMEEYFSVLVYTLVWILLGSFIFNNIFAGVMVNNFQTIRVEFMEAEEKRELDALRKVAIEDNILRLHYDSPQELLDEGEAEDRLKDWEAQVWRNLDLLDLCRSMSQTPQMWPRDTLFLYYVIMSSSCHNTHERAAIIELLNKCTTHCFDDN